MRQAPHVIMVGELRDTETIAAALSAAETGHLVLATLHANNAAQTVERIIDVFPASRQNQIRIQFANVIAGVVAQRLLPMANGLGRRAAFEIMLGVPAVQSLIRENKVFQLQSILETNRNLGMQTMEMAFDELVQSGIVTEAEVANYRSIQ
jgi:twitching motility protein PilT